MMRIAVLGTEPTAADYATALRAVPDVAIVTPIQPVDAVVIDAPVRDRFGLIEQAAAAASWILCDVPLAATLDEAHRIVTACASQSIHLIPAFRLRWLPAVQTLHQSLPDLDQLLSLRLEYQGRAAAQFDDLHVQAVDLLGWLLAAEVKSVHVERRGASGVLALTTLTNNTYALLDVGLELPASHPALTTLKIEVIGTGGTARLDTEAGIIQVFSTNTVFQSIWNGDPGQSVLADFVQMVEQGTPTRTAADAVRVHEIARTMR